MPQGNETDPEKKTGVIALKERRVGQCSVCFTPIDARYVWRSRLTSRAKKYHDELLCDRHAEERMKL
jgi:hypothetical protein